MAREIRRLLDELRNVKSSGRRMTAQQQAATRWIRDMMAADDKGEAFPAPPRNIGSASRRAAIEAEINNLNRIKRGEDEEATVRRLLASQPRPESSPWAIPLATFGYRRK